MIVTPEALKGLIDWAVFSSNLVGQELEEFQASRRPPSVSEAILDRVIANAGTPAPSDDAHISVDSSGSWSVEGLDMVFRTRADAEIAAGVMARVQEIERTEGP